MKPTTHLAELGEVVLEAEGALPQTRLVVADWVGLVQLLPVGLATGNAHHLAGHHLACTQEHGLHSPGDAAFQGKHTSRPTVWATCVIKSVGAVSLLLLATFAT